MWGTERFLPETTRMVVIDIKDINSTYIQSGWGQAGDKVRLFMSDAAYEKALEEVNAGHISISGQAKVHFLGGRLSFDKPLPESVEYQQIEQSIKKYGFAPNKKLINDISALNNLCGQKHSLEDICHLAKNPSGSLEERGLVKGIAEEFKKQELIKIQVAEV